MVSYGPGVAGFEKVNSYSTRELSATHDDLDIARGHVVQAVVDLELPGKGPVGLNLSRFYSSRTYRSSAEVSATANRLWGGMIGNGWHMNIGMRVYVVREYELSNCRVIVDSGSLEIFEATGNAGAEYRTRDTANQSRIELFDAAGVRIQNPHVSRTSPIAKVVMTTPEGVVYTFETEFYNEVHGLYAGDLTVRGFCLNSIGDLFGNKSTITYQEFSPQNQSNTSYATRYIMEVQTSSSLKDNEAVYRIPQIVGQTYKRMIDTINADTRPMNPVYTMSSTTKKLRPISIVDSMGRSISIEYQAVPTGTGICRVSKVTYPGMSGAVNTLAYGYDVSGNLTTVQRNALPPSRYTYTKYTPGYALYYYPHFKKSGTKYTTDRTIVVVDYPTTIVYNGYFTNGRALNSMEALGYATSQKLSYLEGSLLASIETPLGLKTNYLYGDTMKTGPLVAIPTKDANSVGIDYTPLVQAASYPVVVEKQVVTLTSGTLRFQLQYPKTGTAIGPLVPYTGKNTDSVDSAWAFSQVTVDGPSQVEDVTYVFQNGVATSMTQGNRQVATTWNLGRMLPLKVTEKQNGLVVRESETTGYDRYRNPLSQIVRMGTTDTLRREWTYTTDANLIGKNRISLVVVAKETEVTANGNSRSTYREYSAEGMPAAEYWGTNNQGKLLSRRTYDSNGRLATQTLPGPAGLGVTEYSYTESGSIYRTTQTRNGKTVVSEMDKPTGLIVKSTDENGKSTTFEWDAVGRLTKVVPPIGTAQTYTYSTDLKTTTVTALGRTVAYTQDELGRLVLTDNPSGEEDIKPTYYYGDAVQKISVNSGSGWVDKVSTIYDTRLRPTSITKVGQGTWTIQYVDTSAKYRVTVQDPTGTKTTKTVDEWARPIEETEDVGGVNAVSQRSWNGLSNLTQVIDPRLNAVRYEYDSFGRLSTVGNVGKTTSRYSYTYTADGPGFIRRLDEKDRNGNVVRWFTSEYDLEGRLKQVTVATSDATTRVVEKRNYDEAVGTNGKSRLTSAESESVRTEYGYDELGRETSRKTIIPNLKTYVMGYGYNASNGNLATVDFPDGKRIETRYDSNQRPSETWVQGNRLVSYTYYPNGQRKTMSFGNGVVVEYQYTNDNWVSQIKVTQGATELFKETYAYDALGRRTSMQYPKYLETNNTAAVERTYGYDKRDEVTKVSLNGAQRYGYGYDLNQNPTKWETPYGAASGNANTTVATDYDHMSEIRYSDGRILRVVMDTAGNIGQKVRVSSAGVTVETTEYRYTYHNQLAEVWRNGQKVQSNQYNQDRERVSVEDAVNGRKWLYWDPAGRIVGEGREGVGDVVVRYVYAGNEKVAMTRPSGNGTSEKPYYFINDAQGTPLMILDETGKVVSRINMDDWGNLNKYRIGSQTEINYTGKKLDPATGLYYFNQRYYDPEIGRFIQEDLAKEYMNPYVYVGNNATNLIDPDGMASMEGSSMPQPSYPSPVTEAWLLGAGGTGGMSSGSFGSIDIGLRRQGLPNVVQGPMTGGEKNVGGSVLNRIVVAGMNTMSQLFSDWSMNIGGDVTALHLGMSYGSDGGSLAIYALPSFAIGGHISISKDPDIDQSAAFNLSKKGWLSMEWNENKIAISGSLSWPNWPINYSWNPKKKRGN